MECQLVWQAAAAMAAILGVLITIIVNWLILSRAGKDRLVDSFNKLYYRTFELRQEISAITVEEDGEEFFYELDRITENSKIQEKVLDYLTEMEDFFLVLDHGGAKKPFKKLMSLATYQRLSAFYGYILYHRKTTNNNKLFQNYEETLGLIQKIGKIKETLNIHPDKCYIGIRGSDCMFATDYFHSNVAMFSEETLPSVFSIRPNQNKANKEFLPFLANRMKELVRKNPQLYFMFYNSTTAYSFPSEKQGQFICLNKKGLLEFLNNKAELRRWLAKCNIPILPYETMMEQEITLSMLQTRFPGANGYVIQTISGGGGIGTFLVSSCSYNRVREKTQPLRSYLVSIYRKNSVSVNTHVFISDKQTVLSPGSVQIIEVIHDQLCYRGADFIAFRSLPRKCRDEIKKLSRKIANRMRELGYRGVAGIDFLVTQQHEIFCMEINPRFQASSILLDKFLFEHKGTENVAASTFELNEQAFENRMITPLCFEDEVNYSCYYYYKDDHALEDFYAKRDYLLEQGVSICDDGFISIDESAVDTDSYLFRAIFDHAICGISPDTSLWINDNIPVREAPRDLLALKIALLNQGARFLNAGKTDKQGVYESRDIVFDGRPYCEAPVVMNCGYDLNLSRYSPYAIENTEKKTILTYYGKNLGNALVEQDQLIKLSETERRILYFAADRLRIKLIAGCEYKNIGVGCRFCNLPISKKRFTRDEIREALTHLKTLGFPQESSFPLRHILIGGGSCISADIWEDIEWLCRFLKADDFFGDKPLSLMSVLPPREKLQALHNAGLEEVAFNIEISDEALAKEMMPGKRRQGKSAYYSVLEESVRIFGVGKVRSALLVGLEKSNTIMDEVEHIAAIGVIPCLSAFRALPGSDCLNMPQPTNQYLREIYEESTQRLHLMKGAIQELGPACKACRNNMLAI